MAAQSLEVSFLQFLVNLRPQFPHLHMEIIGVIRAEGLMIHEGVDIPHYLPPQCFSPSDSWYLGTFTPREGVGNKNNPDPISERGSPLCINDTDHGVLGLGDRI